MDYNGLLFSKTIDYNGNIIDFVVFGLNFTTLIDFNGLFLSRESIIID